jgi:hypothetical protein
VSFEFSTFRPWFSERGPWSVETVDGASAWVGGPIEKALDDIWDDIDDAGPRFWSGYHVITDTIAADLAAYCPET